MTNKRELLHRYQPLYQENIHYGNLCAHWACTESTVVMFHWLIIHFNFKEMNVWGQGLNSVPWTCYTGTLSLNYIASPRTYVLNHQCKHFSYWVSWLFHFSWLCHASPLTIICYPYFLFIFSVHLSSSNHWLSEPLSYGMNSILGFISSTGTPHCPRSLLNRLSFCFFNASDLSLRPQPIWAILNTLYINKNV